MIDSEIVVPAISAAGGGVGVAWLTRILIKSWLDKHDEMAKAVQQLTNEIGKLQVYIQNFQKTENVTVAHAEKMGAFEQRFRGIDERLQMLHIQINRG